MGSWGSFWLKLIPMTGTSWIHVFGAISGHFTFFVKSEKCVETPVGVGQKSL